MKTLHIKQHYLACICQGRKILEVRVGYPNIRRIKTGERVKLMSQEQEHVVRIREIRHYETFVGMLDSEDASSIAPDVPTKEELLSCLREIYPPEKEQLGVIVLEMDAS
jgi:ASC-1-like (ASCH) protein